MRAGRNFERGNILLSTATLSLMLMFAMFAINAAYYYSFQRRLSATADSIASYAGTFLPNPYRALKAAEEMKKLLETNPFTDDTAFPNLTMTLYIEYWDLVNGTPTLKRAAATSATQNWQNKLPIKSITVSLSADFQAKAVHFTDKGDTGLTTLRVTGEATTQLMPTDVVLVIENSNSVVSPMPNEALQVGQVFTEWKDDSLGSSSANSSAYAPLWAKQVKKGRVRERQCYGQVYLDIKKAAIKAYDYLTSSGTYRVGVVHTKSPFGEYGSTTINITPDSYAKTYQRVTYSTLLNGPDSSDASSFNKLFYSRESNLVYGGYDYEDSRCAALTARAAFKVPLHPLKDYVSSNFYSQTFKTDLTASLNCLGAHDANFCPNNSHLGFASNGTILPRELIWMDSAGKTFESGQPIPRHDYTHMQFAILRAMDMLRTAPARSDKLPVRKRVVLVFTDGVETPSTTENGVNEADIDLVFNRVSERAKAEADFSKSSIDITYPLGQGSKVFDRYCQADASNTITSLTDVYDQSDPDKNLLGIKLGVLFYGTREPFEVADDTVDPLTRLAWLEGHPYSGATTSLSNFRSECNTKWSSHTGRFFMEASSDTVSDNNRIGLHYYEQMVPQVLRSLFVSELLRTNAS
ncbi:MAG: Tad domain-containing protein [Oligoflexia bacterium]|nr:Tad domain-containing protein [Oligoflexia bacterium]